MKRLALAMLLVASSARAEFYNGNQIYQMLLGADVERVAAAAYIAGVHDAGRGVMHCTPIAVNLGQLIDMTRGMLADSPAERHRTADVLIGTMLTRVWPCQSSNRPRPRSPETML